MTSYECIESMIKDLMENKLSIDQVADKYCKCSTPKLRNRLVIGLKMFKHNITK